MTSTEADISSLDDDGFDQRHFLQEPTNEFLTLEELFSMTRVEQLRPLTLALLIARFPQEEVAEAIIGFDLMADLHFGRNRRSGAEEGTHPAMVGILDLLANPDLTVDQLVTDYLHDVIEDRKDLGITARHVSTLLTLRAYPQERARAIAIGVEGLTRDAPKDQETYMGKIKSYDRIVPHLRLRDRKAADTTHNVLSYSREVNDAQSSARAKKYLHEKALRVLTLSDGVFPPSPNALQLKQVIIGCNDVIARQNQNDHVATRIASRQTLFTARVRV